MKKLLGFLLLLLLIGGVAQWVLPNYAATQIQTQMEEAFHPEKIDVTVDSMPAVKMLYGKVDTFGATLEGVTLTSGLRFQDIFIHVKDAQLNVASLYGSQTFQPQSIGSGTIEGILTDADLTTYLKKHIRGLGNAQLTIENNKVLITGDFNLGGLLKGTAAIAGNIYLKGNQLVFAPTDFSINGMNISGLNTAILTTIELYNFADFPISVQAQKVVAENGKIHIYLVPKGR